MNDKNQMSREEQLLKSAAQQVNPSPSFTNELEKKLMNAHKPAKPGLFSVKKIAFTAGWAVGLAALSLTFVWVIRSIAPRPQPQPAAGDTQIFSCPVTQPNGSTPPGETVGSPEYLGNGELWTVLWPDGKVLMEPHNQEADGSFSMKWGWWREVTGPLTIEGRRLDADAPPLRADIPDGYGETGFQVLALIFPTTGCWEVTGRVGDASLTFVTEVLFGSPTSTQEQRSVPEGKTYNNSVGQFIMTVDLPEAPAQAVLYQLDARQENADYQAEKVRDLAARIGVNGSLYQMSERYGGPGYIFTDGKQRIEVSGYGPHQFTYYTDYTRYPLIVNQGNVLSSEEMITKAEEFLKARGLLDFPYQAKLPNNDAYNRMVTFVPRLNDLPESYTFENFTTLQVSFDRNGEVVMVLASIQPWEPIGSYPLISAQQAWDKFITNGLNGLGVEMSSGGFTPSPPDSTYKLWWRDIPLDQPTSLIGMVTSSDAVDGGTPLLIMDNVSLMGNLEGLTNLEGTVQLDGRFIMDGDVRKFQVDSWQPSDPMPTLEGTVEQADGQSWLVTSDGQRLQLEDPPADVQVGERTFVYGIVSGDKLDWRTINQGDGFGGGGGGGGGLGLARVNLSGTPMPTATPVPVPTPVDYSSMVGTRFEGEQGNVDILNLQKDDGSTYFAYKLYRESEEGFLNSFWQVALEGPATEGLEAYYRMPVKIWGTITSVSQQGIATVQLERYEALYPDEKARTFFGQEAKAQVEGRNVLLFTADDGTVYVRKDSMDYEIEPTAAEEGLVFYIIGWSLPDQTFGRYPVLNVMSLGSVPPDYDFDYVLSEILIPPVMKESDMNLSGEILPGIINRVELVYLGEDQLLPQVEEGRILYAQPFWRFSGYFSENSYFDIIVQALPDEYLQPVPLQ